MNFNAFRTFFNKLMPINTPVDIYPYDENGKRHGYWELHQPNSKLYCRGSYANGKQHGCWRYYNVDGNLWCIVNYVHDISQGYWEFYRNDGTIYIKEYHL